eukprot:gb/GEZN01001833.1/.p1 GENE.gb/GEZN01001833.1/~~gb/GEZN01001833.1/.p1  ORF type:complete len:730 (+),score=124.66 gb/GEZN01001833.1/:97-2286(+)
MQVVMVGISLASILAFVSSSRLVQFVALVALLVAYIVKPAKVKPSENRSVPYGTANSNETVPRRSLFSRELVHSCQGCETIPDLFRKAVMDYSNKKFLGQRPVVRMLEEKRELTQDGQKVTKNLKIPVLKSYQWETYKTVGDKVDRFSSGLLKCGLKPREKLAIFANTRSEWMMSAQAAFSQNISIVTVYATLGVPALVHSMKETKVSLVITEAFLVQTLLEVAEEAKNIKHIIYMDTMEEKTLKALQEKRPDIKFTNWQDVVEMGNADDACADAPSKDDIAIIMYTSGSTGTPKGVIVTHQNFIAVVGAVNIFFTNALPNLENPVWLAYLPLAHILEMASEIVLMTRGARIGYSSPRTLKDGDAYDENNKPAGDIKALCPTIMPAVPLVLDRLRQGIEAKAFKDPILKVVFKIAYFLKKKNWLEGRESPVLDKLVFNKVKAQFGGRVMALLCGGAPLSPETQEFMNVVLGAPVLQGYGLTETCAASTLCHPDDRSFNRVGAPLPCNELKLVDCPEMGYTHDYVDGQGVPYPRGEVWFRGYNVSQGYYGLPEKTAEEFVASTDGSELRWFKTGDIAKMHPDGTFEIIDRKKDLVKLRHGEYIALGSLESTYRNSKFVENIAVHGDPTQSNPVALIAPNEPELFKLAKEHGLPNDIEALCTNQTVIDAVMADLQAQATKARLQKCEVPVKIFLAPEPWTPENDMLTTAMKLKRHAVYAKYKPQLAAMYGK